MALARMLAVQPSVILLDEPLSNLDAKLRLDMRAELKRIHDESRSTVMFVTHDQWEAMTLASVIAVMNEGTLQQLDSPDNIYNRPCNRFVAGFVGSPPINFVELGSVETSELSTSVLEYIHGGRTENSVDSVGIRPESIRIGTTANMPDTAYSGQATATGVMPTGGSWIIELTSPAQKLFATTNIPPRIQLGEEVVFRIRREDFHPFDKAGNRVPDSGDALSGPFGYQ